MKILSNNAFNQLLKDSNNLIELQWRYKAATDRVAELEEENKLLKANTNREMGKPSEDTQVYPQSFQKDIP